MGGLSGGGGAFKLIGSVAANNDADITLTGLNTGDEFGTVMIGLSELVPKTDNVIPGLRFGSGGGLIKATDYYDARSEMSANNASSPAETYAETLNTSTMINLTHTSTTNVGNATGEGFGALLTINRPSNGTMRTTVVGHWVFINTIGDVQGGSIFAKRDFSVAFDSLQFLFSSGNISSGRMTAWGLKHG